VVRWFSAKAKGVTMVYRKMAHVHSTRGDITSLPVVDAASVV